MSKKDRKEYMKAYYQANKEKAKAYRQAHKQQTKAWFEAHKEERKEYKKAYAINYMKNELNSLGQTKASIRLKSLRILKKSGIKIPGYEIHHCFTYDDASKFIYCSKELHVKIHKFLRDNHIDADIDHYQQIKHLLDEKVVIFGS